MRRRVPVPLAGAVEALADRLAPRTPLALVQRHWAEAAGEVFAPHTEALSVRGGVVSVRCSAAVYASELTFQQAAVIERLNALAGEELATELRCTAGAGRRRR